MRVLPLVAHPSTPCAYIDSVTVSVDAPAEDLLVFYYQVQGDIGRLRLPAPGRCEQRDGLWQHTCCEAFARLGDASYYEFNFSPSSAWAVYRFEAYRQGMQAIGPEPAPRIICHRREHSLELDVAVHLDALPGLRAAGRAADLRLALAAVLEDQLRHRRGT